MVPTRQPRLPLEGDPAPGGLACRPNLAGRVWFPYGFRGTFVPGHTVRFRPACC